MRRELVDWSSYQGVPNAGALRQRHPALAAGVVKATEGAWKWTNPSMDAQAGQLRANGLGLQFYTFVHPGIAGTSDAQIFLDRIAGYEPQIVWLDCEVSDGLPAGTILPRILEDLNWVNRRYPMRTGIYSANWWWGPNTVGSVAAHMEHWPFWVAGYQATLPGLPVPWTHPLMWQYTDKYDGDMDGSVFFGSDDQWAWITHGVGPAPPPPPHPDIHTRIRQIQAAVHAAIDGVFGADTDKRCEIVRDMRQGGLRVHHPSQVKYLQQVMGFDSKHADGVWGPITQSFWVQTVQHIQAALGVGADGVWGPVTDARFLALDPLR